MIAPLFDPRLWFAISSQIMAAPVQDFWDMVGTRTPTSPQQPTEEVEDRMAVAKLPKLAA